MHVNCITWIPHTAWSDLKVVTGDLITIEMTVTLSIMKKILCFVCCLSWSPDEWGVFALETCWLSLIVKL